MFDRCQENSLHRIFFLKISSGIARLTQEGIIIPFFPQSILLIHDAQPGHDQIPPAVESIGCVE